MSLFRRCKHTWEIKAVRRYTRMEKWTWEKNWTEMGEQTDIHYVCSACQADHKRPVEGAFTFAQANTLFPKP